LEKQTSSMGQKADAGYCGMVGYVERSSEGTAFWKKTQIGVRIVTWDQKCRYSGRP